MSDDATIRTLTEVLRLNSDSGNKRYFLENQKETCICEGHYCNGVTRSASFNAGLLLLASIVSHLAFMWSS